MPAAPLPPNELVRLAALRDYAIVDTDPEATFDDLAFVASAVCDAPIALVTFIDEDRQFLKARIGVDFSETRRNEAFCAHAVAEDVPLLEVPDATFDPRFQDNPFVTGDDGIRFYAGATIRAEGGEALGTVCVLDTKPHDLTDRQREVLLRLGRQATTMLAYRRVSRQLFDALSEVKTLAQLLPICSFCRRIRQDDDYWADLNEYLRVHADSQLSHGICPDCERTQLAQITRG
ncbi:MAG TPA: GAF domain-containing protein [Gemmatimonadales bacterium]|nr:GAF domain-containing protein [Gemmatimonadales bacterium]